MRSFNKFQNAAEKSGIVFYSIAGKERNATLNIEFGKSLFEDGTDSILLADYLKMVRSTDFDNVNAFFSEAMSAPGYSKTIQYITQHGDSGFLSVSNTISNVDGEITGVIKAIEEMPESESLSDIKCKIVDRSTDFIGLADPEGTLVYVNAAGKSMLGYDPDADLGMKHIRDVHANNFDEFALNTVQPEVIKNGFWSGRSYLRHKDGHALEVMQSVYPVFDNEGGFSGTAAVMKDISEFLKLSHDLEKTNSLFIQLLDSICVGIVLIDMEKYEIVLSNDWLSELLQMDKDQIIGRHCHEILCRRNPDLCPHVNEKDQKTLIGERMITRPDGSTVPVLKTGTWITIDNKEYLVDSFVDITHQKNMEKRLNESKIAAETANRAKSDFLSHMSHEMRTPLNAVIGMVQIARRSEDMGKIMSCLSTIETSSNHLLGLINDILDLSKIESGKFELAPEPFSLSSLLGKIKTVIQPKMEEKRIRFSIIQDDALPDILIGDSLRLSQVMLNLLSNSVKFTPDDGKVTLTIKLVTRHDNDATIGFSVTDSGIGMSGEQLSHLFKPFEQADETISRRYGGTGLGLAISQRIINLFGGNIVVTSESGHGSEFAFEIEFPLSESIDDVLGEELLFEDYLGAFEGKCALIVDDVELNRIVAAELISETGIKVAEATDGKAAFDMFLSHDFDIILMDILMPVMDGYEATTRIRASDKHDAKTVPIVAMSANVFKEDVEKSLSHGMNGHIGKPIKVSSLILELKRQIMDKNLASAAVASSVTKHSALLNPAPDFSAIDSRLIDFAKASTDFGDDKKLAQALSEFLNQRLLDSILSDIGNADFISAKARTDQLLEQCSLLSLSGLYRYIGNASQCFKEGNNEFAEYYLNDAMPVYQDTLTAIRMLLL